MIYAISPSGEKISANKNTEGYCENCKEKLIPKCGEINIWHWSHQNKTDCVDYYEPETEWHLGWKKLVKKEFCEVIIGKNRADIINDKRTVIELQNSPLSTDKIKIREQNYNKMIWLVNGINPQNPILPRFDYWEELRNGKVTFFKFRWNYPRKSWIFATKQVFIDFGTEIFLIKKQYGKSGWGFVYKPEQFIETYLKGCLDDRNKKN